MVVRPDHLGDLLFATPALDLLRESYAEAHITALVGPWGRAMWQGNPNLDRLITIEFPGIVAEKTHNLLDPYRLLKAVTPEVASGRFDLGIVLRFDHWWGAALLAAAGVARRWGYDTPGMREWLTNPIPYTPGRHEVEQNMALMQEIVGGVDMKPSLLTVDRARGLPRLHPPKAEQFPASALADWLAAPRRAVIHPGTAAANKLWTIEGWANVTCKMLADGWAVAITGAPDEQRLANAIMSAIGSAAEDSKLVNIAGQTVNLAQLVWVLEQAGMVLGVDSGPLHIADALGKPSLHLYGPSDEKVWGPWGDPQRHRSLRAPGTHPTMQLDVGSPELEGGPEMRAITAEMVIREAGILAAQN